MEESKDEVISNENPFAQDNQSDEELEQVPSNEELE